MQAGGDPAQLPFGNLPRLLLAWGLLGGGADTIARAGTRPVVVRVHATARHGRSERRATRGATRLKNQLTRLFSCSVQLIYADAGHRVQVQSFIADRAEFWWDVKRPAAPVLWDSTIRLGEEFFNEIIAHPVPFDMHTLKALRRSPLGLDLYFWLVYRTFALKHPLTLSWKQLYRQFGADPAKSSENTTVQHFRRDCIRELKKIKRAWPDLHYGTVTGGLLLSPSSPRIPPAQLRLING